MNSQHHNQPCDGYEGDLKAYLDNELPFSRRFQVRAHLASCPKCQEELNFMQTLTTELKAEEMPPLDGDLREKILQSAPKGAPQVEPELPKRKTVRLVFAYGGLGLAGLMFLAPVMSVLSGGGGGSSSDLSSSPRSSVGKSIGLGMQQYTQDYDEYFGSNHNIGGPVSVRRDKWPLYGLQSVSRGDLNERAVHRQGSLTVTVDNAEAKGAAVETIVKNVGGYVANNSLNTVAGGLRSASLDIRVPVERFTVVVQKIGSLGVVSAKNISGEDVTVKLAVATVTRETLQNQLSIAQAQRLRALQKYTPVSKEVRSAGNLVRELSLRVAQAKAEQQAVNKFAALSTLYITLQDQPKATIQPTIGGTLTATGAQAWSSFLSSAKLPLQLLIWILAYSPLWLPALLLWRKFGKKLVLG